jgi:integral membrane protein (TIGR01906 family)
MKITFRLFLTLLSILTPLLLITTAMRIALSPIFVNFEYRLSNFPPDIYGFSKEERLVWANYSIQYLLGKVSEEEFSTLEFPDGIPLFNDREISHMIDVRDLTVVMLNIWRILLVFFIIALFLGWKKNWLRTLVNSLENGAKITIAITLGIFLYVMVNFNHLFTIFHQIFFEGDSWLFFLSDTLIRLFPIKFWQDLFIYIGSFCILISELILTFGRIIYKKNRGKE